MKMENWYVLAYTSNRVKAVEKFLEIKNIEFLCPLKQKPVYVRLDKRCSVRKIFSPVFPGYLFVKMNFNIIHPEKLAAFQYIYGLITFSNYPLPVGADIAKILDEILDAPKELKNSKWNEKWYEFHADKYKGLERKNIPHEFAAILLKEEPAERSIALIKYITESYEQSLKEVKHAS